ncbi:MAG TPA: hypothetical protein HA367_04595 [Candidatus Methanofastidiosum sp.]|nr:hypothetical protein [Methanofastidiosum sp.]
MLEKIDIVKPTKIFLKDHPSLNELWLQNEIAKDPTILGLGELILKDKERIHPKAGRLDLLLQDPDTNKRYEVEVQLGKTDESHIIRTIEYWDIERKRYPQYEHCAVIVAEEITSRFLNVISLFNGFTPLIAIQINAYRINNNHFLVATKILDEMRLGLVDDDEEVTEVTDRNYWEKEKGTPKTIAIVDQVLDLVKLIAPGYELKYNKFYVGLAQNTITDNFIVFRAKKKFTRIEIRLEKSEDIESMIENEGLDIMEYDGKSGRYRLVLYPGDVEKHKDFISKLIAKSKGISDMNF